ncbi:MAG TPA: Crp/Fnr family transcriptional regulator [Elusimicrobiales bacterium]|nr:Crp/Fnr family transcriptional regulator [Elusimicrobiales bacterium]
MEGFTKEQAPECGACRFKTSCIYSKLDAKAQKAWNEIRLARKFKDDEEIYAEGQQSHGVYTVCKGRAKVFSTDARGQQMITSIRHPGETFGQISLFSEKEQFCDSRTMGDTILSFVDKKKLEEFMDGHTGTYKLFLHKIATEMRSLHLRLNDTAYKPARSKVAQALINAISYKSKDTATPAIHGLKRTEIAEITGLALETVVRALAELEKRHIIKREPKAIKILDYATLTKVADPHSARK